ncbi:glycoside hydrolase superfamily [Mucor mucedo]|uniref:glycoside hydrolase superfamily n=1 Tax=Mucor mucedo TaxID=29922 RepID=UPI00221F9AC3|nr:glycoside hydrolase superfamily [Mucor mucedo]KAI7895421.1 glycoside hydrolase superfamily [Mucor mucedo]
MELNGRWFTDTKTKQTLLFKGVNVGGGTKLPVGISSHDRQGYWVDYDRHISFVGRPFPLEEADEHLQRLVNLGFDLLRFIITWEAVEHEGPGIYDEAYLDYVVQILKKCQEYQLRVYIDPHQDSWSRHCGGSGHPGWTLTLAGLNPLAFPDTNAAIVHNLYPEPSDFPKMIWNTNYQKLAASTLFTLFFAGKTFAPQCKVNGIHVQDYLQQHYYDCFKRVATKIHEQGLENTVVIGYDTMNEPGHGYLGNPDITHLSTNDTDFKMGLMPTAFQGMLLGSGIPTTVENWEFKWNGPKKTGKILVDPQGTVAWLDQTQLDAACLTFGWKREWPAGCIWALHGVWDKSTHKVLLPHYFATEPKLGTPTEYMPYWIDYLMTYAECIRSVHWDAIMFVQSPILAIPPKLPASLKRLVYAPHWYDGLTLVKKKWCNYNVDFINLQRGKYGTGPLRFVRALRLGEKSIRQCFVDQLKTMKGEGLEQIGEYPCILGEIGIPYDMEVSTSSIWNWCASFFTSSENISIGDPNSSQTRAMDASINALEQNLLNYSLWTYMPDNSAQWGDEWNGEDLSIWQYSFDRLSNVRDIPSLHRPHPRITSGIPSKIDFVSPSTSTPASFQYTMQHDIHAEGPTEIYVPSCHFPPSSVDVTVTDGTWEMELINEAYWVLRWSMEMHGEATLILKGITFVQQ